MTDTELPESVCVRHEPCPECGSRDNLGRYSDGHGYCFGCGYYEKAEEEMFQSSGEEFGFTSVQDEGSEVQESVFTKGQIKALSKRGINQDTCQKFDYRVAKHNGKSCQVANYHHNQKLVAQKLRYPDKTFSWIGSATGLYGQWLWRDGGKMVVVTEGELDCLSVSMIQQNKWPTVSVKNGAQGAKRDIQKSLEW